jgi:predicted RNase H-like HicB family nuclease
MVSYPIDLITEHDGTVRVLSPHFPELETSGDTVEDALIHAVFALEEVISERMARHQVVPIPLKTEAAERAITLSAAFADMLESYWRYNMGTRPPERPA